MPDIKETVRKSFENIFGEKEDILLSSGGRFEILGNHTDHNHGLCLAATCNLCITAAVKKRNDNTVNLVSYGYLPVTLSLDNLEHSKRKDSSGEMIKGVAAYFKENGYRYGGFDAYSFSTIFAGAGVSSSAAFELLIAHLFNVLYNNGKVPVMVMCKAGQFSENNYYEKKSGLLDQIGVAYGGLVAIDFEDIKNPKVEKIDFPFDDLAFVIVNTGGSHAELNSYYSAIPNDMKNAAAKINKEFLREGSMEEIQNCQVLSENEKSRAIHFYSENERVKKGLQALKNKDKKTFLQMINESRISSTNNLKNMMVDNKYEGSPLQACDRALKIINGKGAAKINGGGFAGSIICVVSKEIVNDFITQMANYYGKKNVCEVFVRPYGPNQEK